MCTSGLWPPGGARHHVCVLRPRVSLFSFSPSLINLFFIPYFFILTYSFTMSPLSFIFPLCKNDYFTFWIFNNMIHHLFVVWNVSVPSSLWLLEKGLLLTQKLLSDHTTHAACSWCDANMFTVNTNTGLLMWCVLMILTTFLTFCLPDRFQMSLTEVSLNCLNSLNGLCAYKFPPFPFFITRLV